MYYKRTTQTPNILFDSHLKTLSYSQLKVLLTIIRKTIGMIDTKDSKQRVARAWISQRLFMICTNLSGRSVSSAIDFLVRDKLVTVTNLKGNILKTKASRRSASALYYSSSLLLDKTQEKKASEPTSYSPVNNLHTIKLMKIKQSCDITSLENKKLTDRERILQIINTS